MPGYLLDGGASIACPHGGRVNAPPAATGISLGGQAPYVLDDFNAPVIAGCPFTISGAPSPCLRVQWLAPAMRVTANGSPVLLSSSMGQCLNAAGVPQGAAVISGYQTRVQGQ